MTTLDVEYTLFDSDGFPIRAVVKATFKQHVDLGQKLAKLNSPDYVLHLIEVKEGDNLPLMCEDIYGDSSFYLQVAAANDIVDFREFSSRSQNSFSKTRKNNMVSPITSNMGIPSCSVIVGGKDVGAKYGFKVCCCNQRD